MHFSSPESISLIRLNISLVWKRISLIQNPYLVFGNVFLFYRRRFPVNGNCCTKNLQYLLKTIQEHLDCHHYQNHSHEPLERNQTALLQNFDERRCN